MGAVGEGPGLMPGLGCGAEGLVAAKHREGAEVLAVRFEIQAVTRRKLGVSLRVNVLRSGVIREELRSAVGVACRQDDSEAVAVARGDFAQGGRGHSHAKLRVAFRL